ncbi:putative thiazole biosynthetic enzyme [Streptomyces sp. RB5]|uniref:Putative thiazole biosynthetic enzyme n=1 Tax=Streptomyces smaragdinus TaxID=2585196 RepID=A0A7K0CGT2_9ACTN|nr:NAD(P)/FAD-dependent oxidoreductase [Streptomyces smaragdinus]MQY12586.1 putative thiazole biosynthetic enzyme [Streptomyces smaragdinus]
MTSLVDVVVVGAGPNGLTAAAELARRGFSVEVFEAADTIGGGARTEELTLPGFRHDPCSAAHPFGISSPAFRALGLERHGLEWVHAELPMAHPFPDGTAAVLSRSVGETAMSLGSRDAGAWRRLVAPFAGRWDVLARDFLTASPGTIPRDPLLLARLGRFGLPASAVMRRFTGERARGLFAGLAAHSAAPSGGFLTGAMGLAFALAGHAVGWPFARGGSQSISDALASVLRLNGGVVHTGVTVKRLDELPPARAYVFDTSPTALARIAGLGNVYEGYRYGPSVFKIDYALSGPVPWTSADARAAGTVHLGPTSAEIDASERAAVSGADPTVPFLITTQPTPADPSRAPEGKHVFWAYGHVPNGWRGDATEAVERQITRFAPDFRDLILARSVMGPPELASRNANYVGGDTACGAFAGLQSLLRPRLARVPWATPHPRVFICSSATPPGPGVHGMGGHNAARAVWRALRRG